MRLPVTHDWHWLVLTALASGCGGFQQATRLEDGSWKIRCGEQIESCVRQATRTCGERDYQILGGGRETKVYGGVTGEQAVARQHTLIVLCDGQPRGLGKPLVDDPPDAAKSQSSAPSEPTRSAAEVTKAEQPTKPPSEPAERVCAPGSTQECVGPGACSGGQSCKDDGSGYLPCDCGDGEGKAATPPSSEGVRK